MTGRVFIEQPFSFTAYTRSSLDLLQLFRSFNVLSYGSQTFNAVGLTLQCKTDNQNFWIVNDSVLK